MSKIWKFLWPSGDKEKRRARWRTVRLLPQVSPALSVFLLLAALASSLIPVAFAVFGGRLVGKIPGAIKAGSGSVESTQVIVLLGTIALLFAVQQLVGPIQDALASHLGNKVDGHLQALSIQVANDPVGLGHLEDPTFQNAAALAKGIATSGFTPGRTVSAVAGVASIYVTMLLSLVVFARFSVTLALIILVILVVARQRWKYEYFKLVQGLLGRTDEIRRAEYLKGLATAPPAAKEMRIFGLGDWVKGRFESTWLNLMRGVWRARTRSTATAILFTAINWVPTIIAFRLLALSAARGSITLGEMSTYALALFATRKLWATVGLYDLPLEYGVASVPAVLDLKDRTTIGSLSRGTKSGASLPRSEILFDGVHFRYPGTEHEVFAGLDLELPAGRSTAIVGVNGAGKTTLIKLLCRLYEPTGGAILVDGVNLNDYAIDSWRSQVAAIFQDFVRYELPLRSNVEFGALHLDLSIADLDTLLEQAGLAELPNNLVKGWDTILSRQYQDGADLSGGQWQRVGLARALAARSSGASVLILDEPTANIDVRGEAELYDKFLELTSGLTTVLISHRFSTVRRAELICVLDEGRLIERGTHDELLDLGGQYAEMFRLQAQRFVDDVPVEAIPEDRLQ